MKCSHSISVFAVRTLMISVALVALAPAAQATVYRVSQESSAGANDFDANILGFINAFTPTNPADTAADLYQYNTPNAASYNGELNGGPDPLSEISQLFVVEAADGVSLFIVHDRPNDGAGGTAATQFDLVGGDTATILVKDDNEGGYTDTGTMFGATHAWVACCTDGYVIGTLEGSWTMFGQFLTFPTGIEGWQATSSGGGDIALALEIGRRVRIDTVPEPASIALLGLGLLGMVYARRRVA